MSALARPASTNLPDPLERVARIAGMIEGSAGRNEAARRLAPELVDELHGQRLFRLLLPKAYGGDEVDPATFLRTMEAIARIDASTAWCVGQINGCAMAAAYLEPRVADEIWGRDARAALCWGPPTRARAVRVPGGYRVSGSWSFGSGSRQATWLGLHTSVVDEKGEPVPQPGGGGLRTLLVPAHQVEMSETWDVLGLEGTGSDSWRVEDLLVPEDHTLVREEPSQRRLAAPLYQFPAMSLFAFGFSAVALGISRAMLEAFVALAADKTPRNTKGVLRDNGAIQLEVAECEARLRAARLLDVTTAERVWAEVVRTGELTLPQRMDIRLATTHAIHEAKAVGDCVWGWAGASAIFASSPFERRFRDLNTVTQQAQGRRLNLQAVGGWLMGLPGDLTWA